MARHGIDMALLSAAEPGLDEVGATRMEVADPYSAGKARLLGWTASALRCRAVLHQLGGGRVGAVTVFGFASDRERVEVLFTSLLLQAGAQLLRERPPHPGESVAAYRRSWLHGFAVQVHRRLVDAERRAEQQAEQQAEERGGAAGGGAGSPGAALVLADRRSRGRARLRRGVPRAGPQPAVGAVGHRVRGGRGRGRACRPGCRGPARAPRPGGVTLPPPAPTRPAGEAVSTGLRTGGHSSRHRRDRATRRRRPVGDRGLPRDATVPSRCT